MTLSMGATISGLDKTAKSLSEARMTQAMEDSLQIIMQSTLMGFQTRKSPKGDTWKKNPDWWQDIKGQDSPLVGMVTSTIQGGDLTGVYRLAKANTKRMMHSLKKSISSGGMVGKVEYTAAAQERAELNQFGGESELEFVAVSSSSPYKHSLIFNVDVIERPHLGVATYPRIGTKTDAEWCEFYFGKEVEIQLKDDFSG